MILGGERVDLKTLARVEMQDPWEGGVGHESEKKV